MQMCEKAKYIIDFVCIFHFVCISHNAERKNQHSKHWTSLSSGIKTYYPLYKQYDIFNFLDIS